MKDDYSYKKLVVYTKAVDFVDHVYALLKQFPKEEQYALCDQLRRAAVSIPSNIAEGMGRKSAKDRAHFVEISYGSILEVNCQLDIAERLGYINDVEHRTMDAESIELAKMLSGLRGSLLNSEERRDERGEKKSSLHSTFSTLDQKLSTLDS